MAKCSACGKFLATKGVATCNVCNNKFHPACVQLKESPKSSMWQCSSCKKKVDTSSTVKKVCGDGCETTTSDPASANASFEDAAEQETYLRGDTVMHSSVDLAHEMKLIRRDIHNMKEELKDELREIQREVADLRRAVSTCHKRIDALEGRVDALEKQQTSDTSPDLGIKFEQTVKHLKMDLNDREQELLSSDLEISNLPESSGENVVHTVELVARKLGVSLESRDIIFAERVGLKNSAVTAESSGVGTGSGQGGSRGRRVVVRLARRELRDELLRSARVRRGATSADLGLAAPP